MDSLAKSSKVLMVGAGGIGCELLKTLAGLLAPPSLPLSLSCST
jgi:hypothetical protein